MSIEVTPRYVEHPDGRVEIDYDNAIVVDNSYKESIHRQHTYEQEHGDDDFVWDPETQTYRHRFADIDPELLDQYGDKYLENPEAYSDDDEVGGHEFSAEEITHIYDQVNGKENYEALLQFAANNLSQEFIEGYDAVIQSGDMENTMEALSLLVDAYNNAVDGSSEYESEDEHKSEDETSELVDSIYELCGGQESYVSMLRWAADHMDESWIAAFDANMESGDYSLMSSMAQRLQSEFYNYHSSY